MFKEFKSLPAAFESMGKKAFRRENLPLSSHTTKFS